MGFESKKVCLIVPSLKAGGMERVMAQIANYLVKDNHIEIHLILLVKESQFFKIDERVTIHEPEIHSANRIVLIIKTLQFLRSKLKSINPEIAVSFGSMYNSFVLLASMGLNIRVYVSDRSNPYRNTYLSIKKDPIKRNDGVIHYFLKKILYKRAYGILVQTEVAKKIEKEYSAHENIILFPNPIRSIKKYPEVEREMWIINVGRFISTKNQILLIKIFAEINNSRWKLIFAGDGAEYVKAKDIVSKLNIADSVRFLGNVKDIDKYLRKSEIFAFASISEGFPNALGEGMKASLACIAFDCVAGPSDMIKDGENGFLVPQGDKSEYKKKLIELMNNDLLREKFQEKASVSMDRYDESVILENFKQEILETQS